MSGNEKLTGIEAARARIAKVNEELGKTDAPEVDDGVEVVKPSEELIVIDEAKTEEEPVEDVTVDEQEKDDDKVSELEAEIAKLKEKNSKLTKKLNDEDGQRGSQLASAQALNAKLMAEIEELKQKKTDVKEDTPAKKTDSDVDSIFEKLPKKIKDEWDESDLKAWIELNSVLGNKSESPDLSDIKSKLEMLEQDKQQSEVEKWFSAVEAEAPGFNEANKSDEGWHEFCQQPVVPGSSQTRAELLSLPETKPQAAINLFKQYKESKGEEVKPKTSKKTLKDLASPKATASDVSVKEDVTTITQAQYERYRKEGATANGDETKLKNWENAKKLKLMGRVI